MPEEEPVCDCEEGEPPDADPGCCGADTCEENETCCNETTCVLTSTFQTDSNNCGDCDIVCEPEETCVAGSCVGDGNNSSMGGTGCCINIFCTCDYSTTPPTCTMDGPNNIYTAYTPGSGAECVEIPVPEDFVCNNDTNSADHDIAFFVLTEEPCRQGCCKRYECDGNDTYVLVSETDSSANCTTPILKVRPLDITTHGLKGRVAHAHQQIAGPAGTSGSTETYLQTLIIAAVLGLLHQVAMLTVKITYALHLI
jgi:hypothetical protein